MNCRFFHGLFAVWGTLGSPGSRVYGHLQRLGPAERPERVKLGCNSYGVPDVSSAGKLREARPIEELTDERKQQ